MKKKSSLSEIIDDLEFEKRNLQIELDKALERGRVSDERFSKITSKINDIHAILSFVKRVLKEKIQNAQKRLKEIGKERLGHLPSDNYELYCEDIGKVFFEEFGEKLIKNDK